MDKKTLKKDKKKKTSVLSLFLFLFFFVFSLVYLVGADVYNIEHHVFQKVTSWKIIGFQKRYLCRRDLKEKNDTT